MADHQKFDKKAGQRLAGTLSLRKLVTIPRKIKQTHLYTCTHTHTHTLTNLYNKQKSDITLYGTFIFEGSQNAYKLLFKPHTGTTEAQPYFGARRRSEMSVEEDILVLEGMWLEGPNRSFLALISAELCR